MTTAVITQPTYLPWLGYFETMAHADVFVVLDVVQFQRRSWHSRNRLKGSDGQPFWLTVPVASAPQRTPLREVLVDGTDWAAKHRRAIETALGGAPHREEALALVDPVLADPPTRLVDLNVALIRAHADALGCSPTWVLASDLPVSGARSELLIDICRAVGADRYHSAAGAQDYMSEEQELWDRSGIEVSFQSWDHPDYPQAGPGPFVGHLAAIDAIANLGAAGAASLIGTGSATPHPTATVSPEVPAP